MKRTGKARAFLQEGTGLPCLPGPQSAWVWHRFRGAAVPAFPGVRYARRADGGRNPVYSPQRASFDKTPG